MREHFFQDKTVEKAIEKAEKELGVEKKFLDIEILEEKDKSVLGMRWGKTCSIKVITKPQGEAPVKAADMAQESLGKLLELVDIKGKIDVREGDDRIVLDAQIDSDVESLFIGRRGKNLDAFQYIVNKIVEKKTEGKAKRIIIDSEGYRAKRQDRLERMANKAIMTVKSSGADYTFPPMKADERRIIHMTVKKEGLLTESKGKGIEKKVVIYPPNHI